MPDRLTDLHATADLLLRVLLTPLAADLADAVLARGRRRGTLTQGDLPGLRLRLHTLIEAKRAPLRSLVEGAIRTAALTGAEDGGFVGAAPALAVDSRTIATRVEAAIADVEERAFRLLTEHARRAVPVATAAQEVRAFLSVEGLPDAAPDREAGSHGLHRVRTLLTTEISAAYGEAVADASPAVRWVLAPSHRDLDRCDENARRDRFGLGAGVYPSGRVPRYPDHPNCRCRLVPTGAFAQRRQR